MRLVLDARRRALLRRLPRANFYSLFELVLLAALAAQCARLAWAIVTPVGAVGDWRPVEPGFAGSPATVLRGFDPFFRSGANGDGIPAVVTSLQLTLFGIRVDEAQGGGSAIIAGADGLQQSIAVGGEISPGVRLKAVAYDHVTIDRGGAAEDLFLDQSGAVATVSPPPVGGSVAPPPTLAPPSRTPTGAGLGTTLAGLRGEIGFIQRIDGGRVTGLTVRSQGSGAAFRAAGLRDGDVVTALAGRPVTGPDDLDRLAAQFSGGGALPITVERGGAILSLVIAVAPQ